MSFQRKSLNPNPVTKAVRKRPFLLFGLPFLSLTVAASFALENFAQARYDLHNAKVTSLNKEEELGMSKNRKKVDLREEYFRLSGGGNDAFSLPSSEVDIPEPAAPKKKKRKNMFDFVSQEDFENVRVPRPAGMPEYGNPVDASLDAPLKGHRSEDRWV